MAEVVNYEASEPKRRKIEENMDDDESLPIIERLKSLREDISNCIGKWGEMDIVEKMANADNLFNKVQDRVNNLIRRGPCGLPLLFSQAKDHQELLQEKEQMEELVALLVEEYWAFKSSHEETYLGEYEDCLWKLYKIEKETNKISAQIPKMSIECEVYERIFELDVDGEELADFNVADLDYDGLMKQMEDMMERSKECDEVCGYLNELILCVDHIIHTIDGLNEDQQWCY